MPIVTAALIGAGGSLLGGYLQGQSAEEAARTEANAKAEAARRAADDARFRPVGITTRFGQSQFQYGPDGRVTGAGYQLTPEMRAYQDRLFGLTGQGLTQAEMAPERFAPLTSAGASLFNLGRQYLAESPQQVAEKYMTTQQSLLAPSRERQYAQLQNKLFQQGTSGLAVGATGARPGGGEGLRAANPELEAYYNAIAQQDAKLAADAQLAGQQQLTYGTGLFGEGARMYDLYGRGQVGALAPYQAYFGGVTGLEAEGRRPLDIGASIGSSIANPQGAQYLYQGGVGAAEAASRADSFNPFASTLASASSSPLLTQGVGRLLSPYINAQQAMNTYGAGNVYGYGGQGTSLAFDPYMDFGI